MAAFERLRKNEHLHVAKFNLEAIGFDVTVLGDKLEISGNDAEAETLVHNAVEGISNRRIMPNNLIHILMDMGLTTGVEHQQLVAY